MFGIIAVMSSHKKSQQSGFTVIELVFVGAVLAVAGVLAYIQMNNLGITSDDLQRKTAVNAMYYALEEVYYKENQSYPATLTTESIPSVDPALFTDPDGFILGKGVLSESELKKLLEDGDAEEGLQQRLASVSLGKGPNYHYDATNCDNKGQCKSYVLRADLQNEEQYVKKSRHN